ncbi:hypothetical protein GLV89_13525 [Halomonas alkaliantarctica]|nr:hypothetical protein [Halomonas alkaliantarctica]
MRLVNDGDIRRGFDASEVEGVETYHLGGTVNLMGLESADAELVMTGRTDDLDLGFAPGAVAGDADTLSLTLEEVGSPDDAVAIAAAGIERAQLDVSGDNVVDLSGLAATHYTVTGGSSLAIEAVANDFEALDAAELEGDLKLALNAGQASRTATIAGGQGNNTLALAGGGTVQYALGGIQTLQLNTAQGQSLTFSARDVEGLATLVLKEAFQGEARLAHLGEQPLEMRLSGESGGSLTVDHADTSVVDVSPQEGAGIQTATTDLVLVESRALDLNVAEGSRYTGTVTTGNADFLDIRVAGEVNNQIVTGASNAALRLTNATDGADSAVDLQAREMVNLNIVTAANLNLQASDLQSLEGLSIETRGDFNLGAPLPSLSTLVASGTGSVSLQDLGSLDQGYGLSIEASGSSHLQAGNLLVGRGQAIDVQADVLGDVELGTLWVGDGDLERPPELVGRSDLIELLDHDYSGRIQLDAGDSNGDVETDEILAEVVDFDASGVTGDVTTVAIGKDLNLVGSDIGFNSLGAVVLDEAELSSGADSDLLVVYAAADEGSTARATLEGGADDDTFAIGNLALAFGEGVWDTPDGTEPPIGATFATITDFTLGEDVLSLPSPVVSAPTPRSEGVTVASHVQTYAADFLSDALNEPVAAEEIEIVEPFLPPYDVFGVFGYAGDTYAITDAFDPGYGDGDQVVQLQGVAADDIQSPDDLFGGVPV